MTLLGKYVYNESFEHRYSCLADKTLYASFECGFRGELISQSTTRPFFEILCDVNWCKMMINNGDVRKSITFAPELAGAILRRAKRNHRSFSSQVSHDMYTVIERSKRTNVLVVNPQKDNRKK